MTQMAILSLCHLLNIVKCCKRSRGTPSFWFEKPEANTQTLKSEIFLVKLQNRVNGTIAPLYNLFSAKENGLKKTAKAMSIIYPGTSGIYLSV
jgi:hypothetical protein